MVGAELLPGIGGITVGTHEEGGVYHFLVRLDDETQAKLDHIEAMLVSLTEEK